MGRNKDIRSESDDISGKVVITMAKKHVGIGIATEGLCIGQSVVDRFDFWKGHKNSYILTRTSPLSFMQMFFDRVLGVPDKTSLPMLEQIMKGDVL